MASDSRTARFGPRTLSLDEAVSAVETALDQIEPGQPDDVEAKLKTALGALATAAREALR